MDIKFNEIKLIELFIDVDDLLKSWQTYQNTHQIGIRATVTRIPDLSESEVCTIIASYHLSGYKCFEYFYRQLIKGTYISYFPQAPSYERFVVLNWSMLYLNVAMVFTLLFALRAKWVVFY